MKLFRPIVRDNRYNIVSNETIRLFESEEQVGEWFDELKRAHEEEECWFGKGNPYYEVRPFGLILLGLEEVNISVLM